MSLTDAVKRAARGYPGGVEGIAARMKKSHSTLEKELRSASGFKLGLEDAAEVVALSHDAGGAHALDLINSLAELVNAEVVLLPDLGNASTNTAGYVANLMREFSDVIASVGEAVADGSVSPNELARIEKHWSEVQSEGQRLVRCLRREVEAVQERRGGAE